MNFLLKWAWPFLTFGMLFTTFVPQILFFNLRGYGLINRLGFALGGLLGNLPVIVIVGTLFVVAARVYGYTITARLVAVSLGMGAFASAILIHPIAVYLWA